MSQHFSWDEDTDIVYNDALLQPLQQRSHYISVLAMLQHYILLCPFQHWEDILCT